MIEIQNHGTKLKENKKAQYFFDRTLFYRAGSFNSRKVSKVRLFSALVCSESKNRFGYF